MIQDRDIDTWKINRRSRVAYQMAPDLE